MGCLKLEPKFKNDALKVVYRNPMLKEKGVQRFLSVDPLTRSYLELSPYQFAHNRPIEFIDIEGLEVISVNDENGKQRAKTTYDETSDGLLKGGIDNIANNDCVTICDITLQNVGPKEVIRNADALREGVIKDVYHEYSYTYSGEDS